MKIVAAIDSLKGSLSSMEAGNAIRQGILNILPQEQVLVIPVADGGEGTTEALLEGLGGKSVSVTVHGPLGTLIQASYGITESGLAIMEMASAAGIVLVGKDKRPLDATTYGVGEMIRDAVGRGCRDFLIGIGGSATNDGGIGMLTALGFSFLDQAGNPVGIAAGALGKVARVSRENVLPELAQCHFRVACDVTNPLCGENGATYIYGPQKGVSADMREPLDHAMEQYAAAVETAMGKEYRNIPGAGAAGGLGFAFLSCLNAQLQPGIELVLDAVGMEQALAGADFVFTGEGRLDHQTAMGKAPAGIARMAKRHGAKVIALAGAVTPGAEACNDNGIDAYFPILRQVVTLDEAMEPAVARENMIKTTEQIVRLIDALR